MAKTPSEGKAGGAFMKPLQPSKELAAIVGKPVIVENKPGALTNIGAEYVAKSKPDGYTLFFTAGNSTFAANAQLFKSLPFDPDRDFTPIVALSDMPLVIVANATLPATTIAQLVEQARAVGCTPDEVQEMYPKAVAMAGLQDSIHLPVKTYSSGMRARLKFAVATARTPEILLIDEALGTGDARFREKAEHRIQEIKEQAGAILVVNHNAAAIAASTKRCIWVERGVLRADGPTSDVLPMYEEHLASGKK